MVELCKVKDENGIVICAYYLYSEDIFLYNAFLFIRYAKYIMEKAQEKLVIEYVKAIMSR